jgi:hypothetical protein
VKAVSAIPKKAEFVAKNDENKVVSHNNACRYMQLQYKYTASWALGVQTFLGVTKVS